MHAEVGLEAQVCTNPKIKEILKAMVREELEVERSRAGKTPDLKGKTLNTPNSGRKFQNQMKDLVKSPSDTTLYGPALNTTLYAPALKRKCNGYDGDNLAN